MMVRFTSLLAVAFLASSAFTLPTAAAPAVAARAACAVPANVVALAAPLPRVTSRMNRGEPVRIVAIGSSSTAGAGASDADHSYPARLAHYLHQRLPGASVSVLNKGSNGEVESDMMPRLQRDVLDEKPDLVVWQVGANTVLRGQDLDSDEALIRNGVKRFKAAGLDVVLMDLQYAPAMLEQPRHGEMQTRIARIAAEERVGLFRRFAVMHQWVQTRQASMSDLVGPDGVHQNDFGYDCIARALATSIQEAIGKGSISRVSIEQ